MLEEILLLPPIELRIEWRHQMEILRRLGVKQAVHLLECRAIERQAFRERTVFQRMQIGIAEILHQRDAVTGAVMDDFRNPQLGLPKESPDRNELGVVLAFFRPMDADERFMHRRFHAHDRAA